MIREPETSQSRLPERFVVEVFSELSQATVQSRWRDINTILRLSMLTGLPMQFDAVLNMICDFAAEIAPYERALLYFWDEAGEQLLLRAARGFDAVSDTIGRGNILNFWATKYGRPVRVTRGPDLQVNNLLQVVGAQSALSVPLLVSNHPMGSFQLFSSKVDAFTDEDAQLLWILALVAENLLTRERANENLLTFAFTDYLTGLKTRGYFEQQLELEIKRCERKKTPLAVIMIDIDFFKPLNDRYGHHVGDQVLRDVATLLAKDMREVDTVARYGGEEFVIILPETAGPGALRVAQRIRKSVEQAKFFAGSPNTIEHLTISLGIAIYGEDARYKRDLIECADVALYEAKARGRNQVVLYSALAYRREVS